MGRGWPIFYNKHGGTRVNSVRHTRAYLVFLFPSATTTMIINYNIVVGHVNIVMRRHTSLYVYGSRSFLGIYDVYVQMYYNMCICVHTNTRRRQAVLRGEGPPPREFLLPCKFKILQVVAPIDPYIKSRV